MLSLDASNPIPSAELVDVVTVACITLLCSGFFGGHWNAPSALPIRPVVVFVVRSQNLPVMFGAKHQRIYWLHSRLWSFSRCVSKSSSLVWKRWRYTNANNVRGSRVAGHRIQCRRRKLNLFRRYRNSATCCRSNLDDH